MSALQARCGVFRADRIKLFGEYDPRGMTAGIFCSETIVLYKSINVSQMRFEAFSKRFLSTVRVFLPRMILRFRFGETALKNVQNEPFYTMLELWKNNVEKYFIHKYNK